MTGTVFNIQRFSLFDGQGVRTVVFLKGCPLSCIWCHNPEGICQTPQLMYNGDRCIGCGECVKVCKNNCHQIQNKIHIYSKENCENCGRCADICCSLSLSMSGECKSVDEVMAIVLRDKHIYAQSGGGITVSGGEPLMQPAFTLELLKSAKSHGISTAIETSGFGDTNMLLKIAQYTDTFLFDCKLTDDNDHKKYCGVDLKLIRKNLGALNEIGASIILRCPIIPNINDNPAHANGIIELAATHGSIKEIHLQPYHNLGISKSIQLGESPKYQSDAPKRDSIQAFANVINSSCDIPVIIN